MSRQTELLIKPTPEEIIRESEEIGLPASEAMKFVLYYESNGWKVGKNPMKCWKSALSGWRVRWLERSKARGEPRAVPIGVQVRAIEKTLETHRGNPDRSWSGRATAKDVEEYRALKKKLG